MTQTRFRFAGGGFGGSETWLWLHGFRYLGGKVCGHRNCPANFPHARNVTNVKICTAPDGASTVHGKRLHIARFQPGFFARVRLPCMWSSTQPPWDCYRRGVFCPIETHVRGEVPLAESHNAAVLQSRLVCAYPRGPRARSPALTGSGQQCNAMWGRLRTHAVFFCLCKRTALTLGMSSAFVIRSIYCSPCTSGCVL